MQPQSKQYRQLPRLGECSSSRWPDLSLAPVRSGGTRKSCVLPRSPTGADITEWAVHPAHPPPVQNSGYQVRGRRGGQLTLSGRGDMLLALCLCLLHRRRMTGLIPEDPLPDTICLPLALQLPPMWRPALCWRVYRALHKRSPPTHPPTHSRNQPSSTPFACMAHTQRGGQNGRKQNRILIWHRPLRASREPSPAVGGHPMAGGRRPTAARR